MITRDEIHGALREIVIDILDADLTQIGDDDDFIDDLDMDSLQAVGMLIQIERRFQIKLPDSEMSAMRSVRAVADLVIVNLEAQAAAAVAPALVVNLATQ